MSVLIDCHTCGKPVSSSAAFCPHCGERWPEGFKRRLRYGLIGLGVAVAGALVITLIISIALWVKWG